MSAHRPVPRLGASVVLLVAAVSANFWSASAQVESPTPSGAASAQVESPTPSGAASAGAAETCVEPEASAEPVIEETLSMPEDFRIALFNGVWEGIRDFYVDPDTNGLDWEAVGDEYAPLVIATDNAHEVYELLREMVGLLEDPFTNFYSADDLADPDAVDPSYVGIGALLDSSAGEDVEGLRLIYVFPESPAAEGGLAARDRVIAVEGDPCVRIADIRGPEGTDVTVSVVSPGEAPRDVTMTRRRVAPVILPEARRLEADPRVGYLRVVALSEQVAIDGIAEALAGFVSDEPVQAEGGIVTDDPIEALVLDLRASNQGAPRVMTELLRAFVSGEVGAFHHRTGSQPIDLEPNDLAEAYAGMPIVVLVDAQSEAEAEQAAAILQDQGRATIVGVQTSGQTHGAQTVDFPDGSLLQLVSFGFQLPDGTTFEGQGVTPDIEVTEDWLDYPESTDPYLVAALRVIDDALAAAEASPSAVPSAASAEASPALEPGTSPVPLGSAVAPAATPSVAPEASLPTVPEATPSAAASPLRAGGVASLTPHPFSHSERPGLEAPDRGRPDTPGRRFVLPQRTSGPRSPGPRPPGHTRADVVPLGETSRDELSALGFESTRRVEVAGHEVAGHDLDQGRVHALTGAGDDGRAARVEGAATR